MSKTTFISRRSALKGLSAAAIAPLIKGCADGEEVPAAEVTWELLRERIDTIVVLSLENRSFDHYFGAYSLVEGRADVDGLTAEMSNALPDGTPVYPYLADKFCQDDPPHSWNSSHDQFNDGANDGFVTEMFSRRPDSAHEVMAYFDRSTLQAAYALADAYAMPQRWFCSLMTSTWPNRFYLHAAQSAGMSSNDLPVESFTDIYTQLNASEVDWGCYYAVVPHMILLPERGLAETEFQDIERFFDQAEQGKLPAVVQIEPLYGFNDDHPPEHPVAAQIFIAQIYEALASSPQWDRCLFIVTYDEHGGFFDHVPPPKTADNHRKDGFNQMGFRVPTIVCGPYIKPGYTNFDVYDHTSILAFIEGMHGIEPLTKRDAAADPMLDLFDVQALVDGTPNAPITIPTIEADDDELYAPECFYETPFAVPESRTGQPELEAYADKYLKGTRLDRRHEMDEVYEWLLAKAEKQGVLKRKSKA